MIIAESAENQAQYGSPAPPCMPLEHDAETETMSASQNREVAERVISTYAESADVESDAPAERIGRSTIVEVVSATKEEHPLIVPLGAHLCHRLSLVRLDGSYAHKELMRFGLDRVHSQPERARRGRPCPWRSSWTWPPRPVPAPS